MGITIPMGKLRRIETTDCTRFADELALLSPYLSDVRGKDFNHHRHTRSIALVSWASLDPGTPDWFASFHSQKSTPTADAAHFCSIVAWILAFAERHHGLASRAQIVVLEPQKEVYLHEDWGLYYALRDRYHLVLASEGSVMISGAEEQEFKTGDVFFYPNKVKHGARNGGDSPRIHLIFDLLPKNRWRQLGRFLWYLIALKRIQQSAARPAATFEQDIVNFTTALQERHFISL